MELKMMLLTARIMSPKLVSPRLTSCAPYQNANAHTNRTIISLKPKARPPRWAFRIPARLGTSSAEW